MDGQAAPPVAADRVVLDRVVAVVNNQAILASDIDDEMRLSVLDPNRGGLGRLTRGAALEQLIARALIQQQIRQEDVESAAPPQTEVDARLAEIRKEIPACVRANCVTDAGWKAFLDAHGLTQQRVEVYLRYRLEILRFIEQRFRQGISISPAEIEAYYKNTLLPQYAKGEATPPLDKVSKRIQEILLQQQVNALFDDWLSNLRKQGDIEVLDPVLEAPAASPQPHPRPNWRRSPARQTAPSPEAKKKANERARNHASRCRRDPLRRNPAQTPPLAPFCASDRVRGVCGNCCALGLLYLGQFGGYREPGAEMDGGMDGAGHRGTRGNCDLPLAAAEP